MLCADCISLASGSGGKTERETLLQTWSIFLLRWPRNKQFMFLSMPDNLLHGHYISFNPNTLPRYLGDFHVFQQPKIESPTLLEKLLSPDLSLRSLCLGYKCRHGFVASYLDNKSTLSSFYERPPQHLSVEMWKHGIYGRGGQRHILHFISWKPSFPHNNIFTFNFRGMFEISSTRKYLFEICLVN